MGYRKYANDYRLEVLERPGKKPKTIAVYKGPHFDYLADASVISGLRKLLPATAFPSAACFAASLFLNGSFTRHYAVIIPYFCSFLFYCYLCAAVCGFLYRKTPYTREQNDTIPSRFPACSLFPLIINVYTLGACIVYWIIDPDVIRPARDILFAILIVVQIVCCAAVFHRRKDFETFEL